MNQVIWPNGHKEVRAIITNQQILYLKEWGCKIIDQKGKLI